MTSTSPTWEEVGKSAKIKTVKFDNGEAVNKQTEAVKSTSCNSCEPEVARRGQSGRKAIEAALSEQNVVKSSLKWAKVAKSI